MKLTALCSVLLVWACAPTHKKDLRNGATLDPSHDQTPATQSGDASKDEDFEIVEMDGDATTFSAPVEESIFKLGTVDLTTAGYLPYPRKGLAFSIFRANFYPQAKILKYRIRLLVWSFLTGIHDSWSPNTGEKLIYNALVALNSPLIKPYKDHFRFTASAELANSLLCKRARIKGLLDSRGAKESAKKYGVPLLKVGIEIWPAGMPEKIIKFTPSRAVEFLCKE